MVEEIPAGFLYILNEAYPSSRVLLWGGWGIYRICQVISDMLETRAQGLRDP